MLILKQNNQTEIGGLRRVGGRWIQNSRKAFSIAWLRKKATQVTVSLNYINRGNIVETWMATVQTKVQEDSYNYHVKCNLSLQRHMIYDICYNKTEIYNRFSSNCLRYYLLLPPYLLIFFVITTCMFSY